MYNILMGMNLKKIFAVFLLLAFLLPTQFVMAEEFKGRVEQVDKAPELDKELFTGATDTLDKNNVVKMTVSQVLSSGYTIEGDEFFAEITEDVKSDAGILVPSGTVVHGSVGKIVDPKNMGRDGYVVLNFDYILTPDGREIPIRGELTTKEGKVKGAAKTVAEHTGYTLLGGVAGGFAALNLLGLEAAIASQGYTIAGGAAIGGVIGLSVAVMRKGDGVLIKPGDELKITMLSETSLPVFRKDAFKQEELLLDGLDVRINSVVYEKDPFGEDNVITLSLGIINNSTKTFSSFDIALASDTKNVFYPSPFGDTSLWLKTIKPGDRAVGKLSFSVNDRKRKHWLVFYDRINKKPVAKLSIDNVYNELKDAAEQKKKNKKRSK